MITLLNYLIEVNIGIILFFMLYRVLLNMETQFTVRRYYLLVSLLIAIVFPLISIPGNSSILPTISTAVPAHWLPEIVVGESSASPSVSAVSESLTVWSIIQYTYLAGLVIFFLKLVIEIFQIIRLIRNASRTNDIIHLQSDIVAFSFFRYIFIGNSSALSTADHDKIISHERIHQQLGHSYDILFIEIFRVLFWFNPIVHRYKKELCIVHEFQADQLAVPEKDIQPYCNLLARVALMSADFSLANHFNNSLTLKRITMMNTVKKKLHWWKPALLLPLAGAFFFFVACQDQVMEDIKDASKSASMIAELPQQVQTRLQELQTSHPGKEFYVLRFDSEDHNKMKKLEQENITSSFVEVIKVADSEKTGSTESYVIFDKNNQTNQLSEITKTDGEVFLVVEESAKPADGMEAYYSRLNTSILYPTQAKEKGVAGKVFVEFVIEIDGTLSDLKILKGIGYGCDEEAIRAIQNNGTWTPAQQRGQAVKQRMVLPVTFSLGASGTLEKTSGIITNQNQLKVEYQIWNDKNTSRVLIGKLLSPDGSPVRGANLVIANTTSGTASNPDGTFRLALPATGSGEVWITHVSYKTSHIKF